MTLLESDLEKINLEVRNLSLRVGKTYSPFNRGYSKVGVESHDAKTIFSKVSLDIKGGSLTAIMGASGSGKTSLLNCLAGRLSRGATINGEILFNDKIVGKNSLDRSKIAYVQQEDHLLPYLTVRETLTYAARLKLGNLYTTNSLKQLVDDTLAQLSLITCADTLIGDSEKRGISGGEKRRTSVGIQLLSNPSVIFLDEPTSGLDAFMALALVETLKNLALQGRTVIISIHQPRSELFNLFDNLILMAKGRLVYAGRKDETAKYFESITYNCPNSIAIADYLLDITSVDNKTPEGEIETLQTIKRLQDAWADKEASHVKPQKVPNDRKRLEKLPNARNIFAQTWILTSRGIKNLSRDKVMTVGLFIESCILGALFGYLFFQLDDDEIGARARINLTFTMAAVQAYALEMLIIFRACKDSLVFVREYNDRMYSVIAHVMSNMLLIILANTVSFMSHILIIFFMSNYMVSFNALYFGMFLIACFLNLITYCTWGLLMAAITHNYPIASLLGNVVNSTFVMTQGFVIPMENLSIYLRWLRFINPGYYFYRVSLSAAFTNQLFGCPDGSDVNQPGCSGNFYLKTLKIEPEDFLEPLLLMTALYAGLIVLNIFFFWIKTQTSGIQFSGKKGSKKKSSKSEKKAATQIKTTAAVNEESATRDLAIQVRHVSLIVSSGFFVRKRKILLNDVSLKFDSGCLNIIIGGSGAGKSSLLKLLAGRQRSSLNNKCKETGAIVYRTADEGYPLGRRQRPAVCSFVPQEDDYLLPHLTVRETMRYSAKLRLPDRYTNAQKMERVENLILELGLKDCANTIVGNAQKKGISGGEKRRLSIAIHLLEDPAILILDEPTTGLDAAVSLSLMKLLRSIADGTGTGRRCNVICTLHQPRADIFEYIDTVTLMTRGGQAVYSGPKSDLIPHFTQLGMRCPPEMNPLDFVIDKSSVDHRNDLATKSTVETLELIIENSPAMNFSERNLAPTKLPSTSPNLTERPNPLKSIFTLLNRNYRCMFRDPTLIIARIFNGIAFGGVLLLFFYQIGKDYSSVQQRITMIQEHVSVVFAGFLAALATYPTDRNNFYLENKENVVSSWQFIVVHFFTALPFEVFSAFIFTILADWLAGFQMEWAMYPIYSACIWALINFGETAGIILCTFFDHVGVAVLFANLMLSVYISITDVFAISTPIAFEYFQKISIPAYYATYRMSKELEDITFTCKDYQKVYLPDGSSRCIFETGADVQKVYDLEIDATYFPVIMMLSLAIAYRVVAWLLIWLRLSFTK